MDNLSMDSPTNMQHLIVRAVTRVIDAARVENGLGRISEHDVMTIAVQLMKTDNKVEAIKAIRELSGDQPYKRMTLPANVSTWVADILREEFAESASSATLGLKEAKDLVEFIWMNWDC